MADLAIVFVIGVVEWGVAITRARLVIYGRRVPVALLLFCEQALGLLVIAKLLDGRGTLDLAGIIAYSLGGALAALMTVGGRHA